MHHFRAVPLYRKAIKGAPGSTASWNTFGHKHETDFMGSFTKSPFRQTINRTSHTHVRQRCSIYRLSRNCRRLSQLIFLAPWKNLAISIASSATRSFSIKYLYPYNNKNSYINIYSCNIYTTQILVLSEVYLLDQKYSGARLIRTANARKNRANYPST